MRVWGQLDATRIAPIRDMRIYDGNAESGQLHFGAYESGCEALAWIVEHRELTRVFDAAIAFQQRVERFAVGADHVSIGDAHATVSTSVGDVSGALLIGADGAGSTVRQQAGIGTRIKPYDQTAVVANFALGRSHHGVAHQWFIDGGVIALLPLPGDAVSLVWSAPRAQAEIVLAESAEKLGAHLATVAGRIYPSFAPLGGISGYPLSMLRADALTAPRVALVGDAAHVIHPLAGQGLNLGMDDARTLIQCVAGRESFRDAGDAVLLRRFARQRAEAIWAMGELTDRLHRLYGSSDPVLRRLRATGLNVLDRLPFVKQALARQAMR
jgi:ubiquinone biosynthesis UbiH/UbiF/VisC/COQ6 family hydroxylase